MYDKDILKEQAQKLGFQIGVFEKVCRLIEILRFINETNELREVLALKGGTAINLAVFNMPRLSVDIDLDFTLNLNKEETRLERELISNLLKNYMTFEGYCLKDKSKHTYIFDSFVYSYVNASGNSDNIKVEINYSLRCHIFKAFYVTVSNLDYFVPFTVRILSPVEIFASKIVAFSGRAAARDLYDLNNMVNNNLFDKSDIILLRKCAVFYLAVSGDVKADGLRFELIDKITPYKVKTDLIPIINNLERFDLKAALERVSTFLSKHMELSLEELTFLKHFVAGSYEPELLFGDSEILKRIENHPMVKWRLQGIQSMM
jgi:predicted nucleotidyltransferase component of viral defense system